MRDPTPSTQPHLLMGEIWAEPVGNMTWNPLNISAASGPWNLCPHHPPHPLNRTGRGVSCDYFPLFLLLGFRSGDPHCQRRAAGLQRKRIQTGRSLCFCSGSVGATRRFPGSGVVMVNRFQSWGSEGGGERATCCRPIFNNLTWTYIWQGWCQQQLIVSLCLFFWNSDAELKPWLWHKTTNQWIEWVSFHF